MNKKNLYREEEISESDENANEDEEESEDDIVDYGDMVLENNTGISFFKASEKTVRESDKIANKEINLVENSNVKNNVQKSESSEYCNNTNFKNEPNILEYQNENFKLYSEQAEDYQHSRDNSQSPRDLQRLNKKSDEKLETEIKNKLDLLDLDLESMPKDDLVNLLLQSDQPQENPKKKKYKQINSKLEKSSSIGVYSTIAQAQDLIETKDPELSSDFNTALTKILSKMVKDSDNPNNEVLDILLQDKDKIEDELRKYNDFTKRNKIDEKVKSWIEKKNKNLEIIQEKLNEDFQKNCTFAPSVQKGANQKRNLNQFLEDQEQHKKKIQTKLDQLREERIRETNNDYQTAPKINESSKKMVEEKLNKEGNKVHERLYNKRQAGREKKDSISGVGVNKTTKSSPKANKKIDSSKKLEDRTQLLYQDAKKRQIKLLEMQKPKNDTNSYKSSMNSNKFFLRKFKTQFREEVEKLLQEIVKDQISNNSEQPIITGNSTPNISKLNLQQMCSLLKNLNFLSQTSSNQSHEIDNPLSTKNQERKLVTEMYENMKDSEGFVNLDHIFIYCLSILNLLEYFIVKSYKLDNDELTELQSQTLNSQPSTKTLRSSVSNTKILSKTNSVLTLGEDTYNNLVHKLNLDLNSRIINSKKYGGFDEEQNFIITFSQAKMIFKDFNLFSFNYNNTGQKKQKLVVEEELSFKPKINPKSIQLSNKYRQKVIEELDSLDIKNSKVTSDIQDYYSNPTCLKPSIINNSRPSTSASQPDYTDILLMKKKKQEKLNEKMREEKQLRELENCTFKPKINTYTPKDNVCPIDALQKDQRIEILYKKGTELLINKKDKTKEDLEIEKYGKECTFKPNINERDIDAIFENKLHDRDLEKHNERMRRGRLEREIKESAHRRGEDYLSPKKVFENEEREKRNKSGNKMNSKILGGINPNENEQRKSLTNNIFEEIDELQETINPIKNISRINLPEEQENFSRELDSLSQTLKREISSGNGSILKTNQNPIPLLIIDVNIKPGEKRKITVYDGDTAEQLAFNFAKEHNLDNNTRLKLQTLINNQLSRVLTKIIEEDTIKSSIGYS